MFPLSLAEKQIIYSAVSAIEILGLFLRNTLSSASSDQSTFSYEIIAILGKYFCNLTLERIDHLSTRIKRINKLLWFTNSTGPL